MRFSLLLSLLFLLVNTLVFCQEAITPEQKLAEYQKTIKERADKIVANLNIEDKSNSITVRDIIAAQYSSLNDVYNWRDERIKALKSTITDKAVLEDSVKLIQDQTTSKTAALHKDYITALEKNLDATQVEKVKDGMTYGVVPLTYRSYQEMIPTLKENEKRQILTWLIEAREFAMDAESSQKKHAWFGKYKGRINNYLSAAGYDLKKEGNDWQARQKAAKTASPGN